MLQQEFDKLAAHADQFGIQEKDKAELEYANLAVYLQTAKDSSLRRKKNITLVGYACSDLAKIGQKFTNPFEKYSHYTITEVDLSAGRILIRKDDNKTYIK